MENRAGAPSLPQSEDEGIGEMSVHLEEDDKNHGWSEGSSGLHFGVNCGTDANEVRVWICSGRARKNVMFRAYMVEGKDQSGWGWICMGLGFWRKEVLGQTISMDREKALQRKRKLVKFLVGILYAVLDPLSFSCGNKKT
ncbi:hypothetical protein NL676_005860 [Syzygium grande]|nr:hypothetical protein NL676_005860 [Syzygium grande]